MISSHEARIKLLLQLGPTARVLGEERLIVLMRFPPIRLQMPVSSARSPPMCGCTYSDGDLRAEEQTPHVARHAEVDQPRFDHRIDDDHFAAAPPHVHQRPHQPRMVARRVAADDEHQVRLLDILAAPPSPCRCR